MSGCLVVMQPTFLPWAGYFNLMAQADDFVFLDDVQLEKQSWQTRNRWLVGGRPAWAIVSVRHRALAQTLMQTEVMPRNCWQNKLMRGFSLNYGRHPYFGEAWRILQEMPTHDGTHLAEMNEAVIRFVARMLELPVRFHRASTLSSRGVRSSRLVALCRELNANCYLSPQGAAQYLTEDRFVEQSPVMLRFQDYAPMPYTQRGATQFASHLSIVDVVANLGWRGTLEYVKTGTVP